MDFLVVEQIWAIAMVLFGAFILNTCSRWERDEKTIASDPRNRFGKKYKEDQTQVYTREYHDHGRHPPMPRRHGPLPDARYTLTTSCFQEFF